MTRKIINVGQEPGGLGDGDTLRSAFVKTNDNFGELYSLFPVSDTTLDHGDAATPGTVAEAMAQCAALGGGTVLLGPGEFVFSTDTLSMGANCQLAGAGKNATRLIVQHQSNAISIGSGTLGKLGLWSIRDLHIELPDTSSASAIATIPSQASSGAVGNIMITGGGPDSWGLDMDGAIDVHVSDLRYQGNGSGINWHNSTNYPVNYGDALIENTTIVLRTASTTGVRLASPVTPGATNNKRINNVLISRVEVQTPDGIVRSGTIGVHLRNAARITLLNVDVEHMETGILQESAVSDGAVAVSNAFMQTYAIGCTNDYVEVGQTPVNQLIVGGDGDFHDQQLLPSGNIFAEHSVLGRNRVLTGVRPIEAYTDSGVPRVLTVADSGVIFTNKNAAGPVTFVLPAASQSYSLEYEFHLATSGSSIRVQPTGNDLIRPGQTASGGVYESGTTFGQVLKIRNVDGTTWSTIAQSGVWNTV